MAKLKWHLLAKLGLKGYDITTYYYLLLLVAWDLVLGSWFFIGAFSTYFWHLSQNMRQDVVYSQLYMWKHVGGGGGGQIGLQLITI
jgi:hypothetical protein